MLSFLGDARVSFWEEYSSLSIPDGNKKRNNVRSSDYDSIVSGVMQSDRNGFITAFYKKELIKLGFSDNSMLVCIFI